MLITAKIILLIIGYLIAIAAGAFMQDHESGKGLSSFVIGAAIIAFAAFL